MVNITFNILTVAGEKKFVEHFAFGFEHQINWHYVGLSPVVEEDKTYKSNIQPYRFEGKGGCFYEEEIEIEDVETSTSAGELEEASVKIAVHTPCEEPLPWLTTMSRVYPMLRFNLKWTDSDNYGTFGEEDYCNAKINRHVFGDDDTTADEYIKLHWPDLYQRELDNREDDADEN